jgi:hypothetical protein
VLRDWGNNQAFHFAEALTGVCGFGATGSGKTSGPAKHLAAGEVRFELSPLCACEAQCPVLIFPIAQTWLICFASRTQGRRRSDGKSLWTSGQRAPEGDGKTIELWSNRASKRC